MQDLLDEKNLEAADRLGRVLAVSHRYDFQTGFLNYKPFEEAFASLVRNRLPEQRFALVWIDVRNLRQEFLLRGAEGDEQMVRYIAETLRAVAGPGALLGRFGGNSFLSAMPANKFDAEDRYRIQSIADALRPSVIAAGEAVPEIASGASFFPSDTESAAEMIRFAGLAAAHAASVRSAAVIPFQPEMSDLVVRDYQIALEIHKSLDEGLFTTVYQPQVDLRTGSVLGAEASTRWRHPEWGEVPLSEFVPIAERSRLVHRLFDRCLRAALEDACEWREQGLAGGLDVPVISVPVSSADVRRQDFVSNVRQLLAEIPIAPTELELKVTASMLVDDEDLFDVRLRQLRSAGVRIAIADFSTRYTNFNVLKRLPLSSMRIDECFNRGIHASESLEGLCKTILAMAKSLKLHTVAEGIENREELEVLRRMGCDAGQGPLFQQAVAVEGFTEFLRQWPARKGAFGFAEPHV